MQSLPTLKLPFLALINVIDKAKNCKLLFILDSQSLTFFSFVFSLVSNRTKNLATAASRSVRLLRWNLDFLGNEHENRIYVETGALMQFPMPKTLEEAGQTEKLEEWKVNGQLIQMYRTGYEWFIGDRSRGKEHYYELMDIISARILKIFSCESFELCTGFRSAPEDLFVYKHTRQFNELMYCGGGNMPADQLKLVLEQLEVSTSLAINHKVPGFRWSGPLTLYLLDVGDAEWLTFEALMNNECNILHLYEHIFTGAELNTFLKKWLAGGFPNLEYCTFESQTEYSRDEVLQGVETMRSNQTNHPENRAKHPLHAIYAFDNEHNDLSIGVDIRSNNGVLATIDVDNSTFAMAVWNNV